MREFSADETQNNVQSNNTDIALGDIEFSIEGEVSFKRKHFDTMCGAVLCKSADDSVLDAFPLCSTKQNSISNIDRIKEINAQYKVHLFQIKHPT